LLALLPLLAVLTACGGNGGGLGSLTTPVTPAAGSPTPGASTPDYLRAALDDNPRLPGTYVRPNPGPDGIYPSDDDRMHVAQGVSVPLCTAGQVAGDQIGRCYNSNPPTSGLHSSNVAAFRVLENGASKEALVHNMEHGGVVIWYNTTNAAAIAQLTGIAMEALAQRKVVVMSPYPDMEPETIALTAWTRLDKFPVSQLTPQRVRDFIAVHERRFNPEDF